jgi:hypothetical protein
MPHFKGWPFAVGVANRKGVANKISSWRGQFANAGNYSHAKKQSRATTSMESAHRKENDRVIEHALVTQMSHHRGRPYGQPD